MSNNYGRPMIAPDQSSTPVCDPSEAILQKCVNCESEFFDKRFKIGKISSVAPRNRTGKDLLSETFFFFCHECGHLLGNPKPIQN